MLALLNFPVAATVGGGYNEYFVSLDRLRNDPGRVNPWHRWFNEHAAEGRVLLVGDARPFDLEVPVLYSTCFNDSLLERIAQGQSPEAIARSLGELGVTHVYVHWGEIKRYRDTYGFSEFIQPELFDRLVAAHVLEPLPPIDSHSSVGYRVVRSTRLP